MDRVALWLTADHKVIDGLWVGSYHGENAEAVLQRVEAALGLIKTWDRPRYNRLTRDLDRIWVRRIASGAGHLDHRLWACILDERFVLAESTDAEMIAGAIVHEAVHARLDRGGFDYEEDQRERVEAICNRRMLAFARKLPDGSGVRAWAEANLVPDPSYYAHAAINEREQAGALRLLEEVRPRWLARVVVAIFKAARRRAERRRLRSGPPTS
jgi:hypothetical protein